MNTDSFAALQTGSGRNNLLSQTGVGTAETIFTMGTDTGTANAFVTIPSGTGVIGSNNPLDPNASAASLSGNVGRPNTYRGSRPYFSTSSFNGRAFVINLSGAYTTSAAAGGTGHIIKLYQNSSAALGGNALLTLTSSTSEAAGNWNFQAQATLLWDSTSQKLAGYASGYIGETYKTGAIVGPVTGLTSIASLLFVASVTFASGAANVITPVEFSISQI